MHFADTLKYHPCKIVSQTSHCCIMSKGELDSGPLKPIYYTVCGAFSGAITRVIAQPLDVLKIRFQLQSEPIRKKQVCVHRILPIFRKI